MGLCEPVPFLILDGDQFHIKDQIGVGRDILAGTSAAVSQWGRDEESAFFPKLHAGHAFIPPLDNLSPTEGEDKRCASVDGAVEFFALFPILVEPACVMNVYLLAGCCYRTLTFLDDFIPYASWGVIFFGFAHVCVSS